jgi:hypothetical protein
LLRGVEGPCGALARSGEIEDIPHSNAAVGARRNEGGASGDRIDLP